jgi:5'-nucleotidase
LITAVQRRRVQFILVGGVFFAAFAHGATDTRTGPRTPASATTSPATAGPTGARTLAPSAARAPAPPAPRVERPASALTVSLPPAPKAPPPPRLPQVARCAGAMNPLPTHARARCDGTPGPERVRILHVGDMHGHWHPYLHGHSPFSYLRAFADARRAASGGRTLFLDAGDDLEKGALGEYRSSGEATVAMLDQLGLDARTIGNHDFGYGVESVLRQAESPVYDLLASNLTYAPPKASALGEFKAKRTVVYQVGCVRIGVFGISINGYDETDERVDAPYLGVFEQKHDPGDTDRYVGVATELVKELRERDGVDFVIGLNHLGATRDKLLIDGVPGLDLVISAHDHTPIKGYMAGRYGIAVNSGTFIGDWSKPAVGEIEFEIDPRTRTGRLLSAEQFEISSLGRFDEGVEAEVKRLQACFAPDANEEVGDLVTPMGSANQGEWTPVFDAALKKRFPDADALLYEAWTWASVFKGSIFPGNVSAQNVLDAMFVEHQRPGGPGFNAFVEVPVKGAVLAEICKAPLAEPESWKKVRRVCPKAEEIDDAKTYRLVIERRPLHAPSFVLDKVPEGFPRPEEALGPAAEAYELFLDYARDRGRQCLAIDADVKGRCFGAKP